jgi:multisubunit Na+/H+ antiporter MnhE subunit
MGAAMNYKTLLLAIAVVLVAGCRTAPIYNVSDSTVVVAAGTQATMDNVKTAILRAGNRLGWQMTETAPGMITARISLRNHTATAEVKYNTKTYSIRYLDSTNLDASGGNIHKNYNGWIENLDREIRADLLKT